ncbi:MAG: sirohydrochlorin cobaltochelatase [Deltaproteobacteria bacterium]|nr:MAG: sirohydrochlorin cobaltochelatase [Deltaproteobacteria bacterium]
MKKFNYFCIAFILSLSLAASSFAMGRQKIKKAIVLAGFGTSYPSALISFTDLQKEAQKAFPGVKVKIAFTSNIIRKIWHKRQDDKQFLKDNKNIPEEILFVKGPLATIADLQDEGYNTIIVQPTHVYEGEEYTDLSSYISGLNAIKTVKKKYMPFKKLVLGRPILGKKGPEYDYHKDMEICAKAMAGDVALAKNDRAALVYMGHGNEFLTTGAYIEFQQTMRKMYPDTPIFIGTVEGYPSLENVVNGLMHSKIEKIVLKPLMIVAGDHANNDMAGKDDDSWKNVIKAHGITVITVIHGIGENPEIGKILIRHIKDAARDNKIKL